MMDYYVCLSPNHSGKRTHVIDRITPHCVVGQCTVEALGSIFADPQRQASSNYGIGYDGRIGLYVEEENRSWCSSSAENDQRAVTIECASDTVYPYAFKDAVFDTLIDLCVDICRRYGKSRLIWLNDREKTLAYEPQPEEMVITVHRWFAATVCPGDWLYSRLDKLAEKVTDRIKPGLSYDQFCAYMDRYNQEKARDGASDWAEDALAWACEAGILRGNENGNLMPQSTLNREQFAVMLQRYDWRQR